jgi:hypothetical protein
LGPFIGHEVEEGYSALPCGERTGPLTPGLGHVLEFSVADAGGAVVIASSSFREVPKTPSVAWLVVASAGDLVRSVDVQAAPQRWSYRLAEERSGASWLASCLILDEAKG